MMQHRMVSSAANQKIFFPIVRLIFIDMMYDLSIAQGTAEHTFGNDDMFDRAPLVPCGHMALRNNSKDISIGPNRPMILQIRRCCPVCRIN